MQDIPGLSTYPGIQMARFGLNPYGEPMYRIVFSNSRKHLIAGEWPDGSVCARWRPKHRQINNLWILERWRSAMAHHDGLTRDKWDRKFPSLPYQERGDYDLCFTFEACGPIDANLDKLIMWIEEGMTRSYQEHHDACHAEYQAEEKSIASEAFDRLSNVLPAFGSTAMSGYVSRGTKTGMFDRRAPRSMPVGKNKFVGRMMVNPLAGISPP